MKEYEYPAFSAYGVEIEYMIVDSTTLDIRPIADELLNLVGGAEDMDVERGEAAWSNELALHVIEVKTAGPVSDLPRARGVFSRQVKDINALLEPLGARLMPGGMHPWMDPLRETRLWPHQNDEIYSAFDRIFGCSGHGWSNLQSTHINFPFSTPAEFESLHAACRFVLPLVPALAASSPYLSAQRGGGLSTRVLVYRGNCSKVPSVAGAVIPEPVYTEKDYQALLQSIYLDLRPHDPEAILAHEWVNARGCIARFDRGAIEIRLIDAQECPGQDLAVVALVTRLVRALAQGELLPLSELKSWETESLVQQLQAAVVDGSQASVSSEYSAAWGSGGRTMRGLILDLVARFPVEEALRPGLGLIATQGSLAERLVRQLGPEPSRQELARAYSRLCDCLRDDEPFTQAG